MEARSEKRDAGVDRSLRERRDEALAPSGSGGDHCVLSVGIARAKRTELKLRPYVLKNVPRALCRAISSLRALRGSTRRARIVAPLLGLFAIFAAAQCYPTGSRVVVFVQGYYTTYDETGTQPTVNEGQRFNVLKNAFIAKGYDRKSLLDFSYTGGSVTSDGVWHPNDYTCDKTDRVANDNLVPLENMLRDYKSHHKNAHFTLVGHSLGGYLSFIEGARDAARPPPEKLGIDVVVTLDAPLKGSSPDKAAIINLIPCDKTLAAGAEIVNEKFDAATPDIRRYQAAVMAQAGIRVGTFGNLFDCLWNTGHCLPGGTWIDDSDTQFLDGQAAVSMSYLIESPALLSHDAILADPTAVNDAVTFVGAR